MSIPATAAVALVACFHLGFLVLEMFLWTTPTGRRIFRLTPEHAAITAVLAKNQGLYNGFLAAGLGWGLALAASGAPHAAEVQTFFLACVIVAGVYGAATVGKSILFVQALPAALALALVRAG